MCGLPNADALLSISVAVRVHVTRVGIQMYYLALRNIKEPRVFIRRCIEAMSSFNTRAAGASA